MKKAKIEIKNFKKLLNKRNIIIVSSLSVILGIGLVVLNITNSKNAEKIEKEQKIIQRNTSIYKDIGIPTNKEKLETHNKENVENIMKNEEFKIETNKGSNKDKSEEKIDEREQQKKQEIELINTASNEIKSEVSNINLEYKERFKEDEEFLFMEQLIKTGGLKDNETLVLGINYDDYLKSVAHYWYYKPSYPFTYKNFKMQTNLYNNLIKQGIYKKNFDPSKMKNKAFTSVSGVKIDQREAKFKLVFTYENEVYEALFGSMNLKPDLLDIQIKR